jgi:hypothetical protein
LYLWNYIFFVGLATYSLVLNLFQNHTF